LPELNRSFVAVLLVPAGFPVYFWNAPSQRSLSPSRNNLENDMKIRTAMTVATIALMPTFALAQGTTARGAAEGSATGGAVGGPLGAAVGGTVGAAVGAAAEIPNAVIMSVQGAPRSSIRIRERVVIGEPLPRTVELRRVPRYSEYRYAVVNDQRVIVDPRTRRVIRIIE
jgi:hypothetical protein